MIDFVLAKLAELSAPANTLILLGILFAMRTLRSDIKEVRAEVKTIKENDIAHLHVDVASIKTDLGALRTTVQNISNFIISSFTHK